MQELTKEATKAREPEFPAPHIEWWRDGNYSDYVVEVYAENFVLIEGIRTTKEALNDDLKYMSEKYGITDIREW